MITCEFCGAKAGQEHDHRWHVVKAQIAALEKFVTREPAATAEQPSTTKGCADCLLCGICQTHAPGEHDERCHQGVTADPMDIESIVGDMAAEQPSLQETGGGNDPHDILCDCPPCYAEAEIRETERKRRDILTYDRKVGIDSGAPAPKCDPDPPREVAPDRTPCSELCGSKFIVEARREVIAGDRKSVHERDGHCYSTIACLTARKCVNK